MFVSIPIIHGPGKVTIGEGCVFGEGVVIHAVNEVSIGQKVKIDAKAFINDAVNQYRDIGVPISKQGYAAMDTKIFIGDGTIIGDGAVIIGNVMIGQDCIIMPKSVVNVNLPAMSIVSGNPAFALLYRNMPTKPSSEPLMSICIPTYNRSHFLKLCLTSIYSQKFDHSLIEVIVSDNCSTDDTPEIVENYKRLFPNLRYIRNETNIGPDRNILKVIQEAKGTFVKMQGDDDFYVDGTISLLLDVLSSHLDYGVVHVHVHRDDGSTYEGEGVQAFLHASTIMSTFISGTILRRQDLERIEQQDRFIHTSFNQTYLQFEILQSNPRFCVINRSMFHYGSVEPSGYNFGQVVFRGYQSILKYFIGKGLTEEDFREEKKRSLFGYILPWFRGIVTEKMKTDISDFEQIYTEHYADEPYYEEALNIIRLIQNET
jgi:abequosyltransferase